MYLQPLGIANVVNDTVAGAQTGARIARLGSGDYVIVWTQDAAGGASVVRYQMFNFFGWRLGNEGTVDFGFDIEATSVAAIGPTGFAIATEERFGGQLDANVAIVGVPGVTEPYNLLDRTASDETGTALASIVDGYGAAFERGGDIFFRFVPLAGMNQDEIPGSISLSGATAAVEMDPDIARTVFGTSLIVWHDSTGNRILAREVHPVLGAGPEIVVAEGVGGLVRPQVATTSTGGFVVAYQEWSPTSGWDVFFRVVGHGPNVEHRVGVDRIGMTAGDQRGAEVLVLSDGTILILWADTTLGTINAQRFDLAGNPLGVRVADPVSDATLVDRWLTLGTTTAADPDIEAVELGGGTIVVTWGGSDPDGPGIVQRLITTTSVYTGTAGDDNVRGSESLSFSDSMLGGAGNDWLQGAGGNDRLDGGIGDDLLQGDDGNDRLRGDAGNDDLDGWTGNDWLDGGEGDDGLFGGDGGDRMAGGLGADAAYAGDGADLASGGDGNDSLYGDDGNDRLLGGNGDDSLWGGGDDDRIEGGAGRDWLRGQDGTDSLYGGASDDRLEGGNGADTIVGGLGRDTVSFEVATAGVRFALDRSFAGTGHAAGDLVQEVESIHGSVHGDRLRGDAAGNGIQGDRGADRLEGMAGADSISGGDGNDRLEGGAGNDWLAGGAGADLLTGGADADLFVFLTTADSGPGVLRDRIADWQDGLDRIDLRAVDANEALTGDQRFVYDRDGVVATGEIGQSVVNGSLLLQLNTDADAAIEMQILLVGITTPLGAGDILA